MKGLLYVSILIRQNHPSISSTSITYAVFHINFGIVFFGNIIDLKPMLPET
ncbi:hypothetical protein [Chryseobacterium sp. RLHN22]|uniref:hypothetical protein n=1 Tax=Chryseobacterium sp. RLHN22 TaxID=3437885 RepID=UPI003D9B5003